MGASRLAIRLLMVTFAAGLFTGCGNGNFWNWLYRSENDLDVAFETGNSSRPTAETLYAMARILAAQGRGAECEAVLTRTIREYPRFMPAYCDLAEAQLRSHRTDDAIRTLEAGLRISPRDPILLNNIGMCWFLKGDYDKCLAMFTRAAGVVPQNARYRANMAMALGMQGRYEEALSLYKQVLPEADAHYNLGVLCESRGDGDRAIEEHARSEDLRG